MKVKINTHGNALPEVHGEWIDLCTAEDVTLDFLEYKIISLGVSIEIPAGYYAHVVPRSSTFGKKTGSETWLETPLTVKRAWRCLSGWQRGRKAYL